MSRRRVTVEEWIKEALSDEDKGGPCCAISLVHARSMGVGTEEVHTKEITTTTASSAQLGTFFVNKACAYAQDMPGLQTFRLLAFYNTTAAAPTNDVPGSFKTPNEPRASFTFTVFEGQLTAGEQAPWSKHEPSQQGLLAQLMKHNEQIMGNYTGLVQGMMGMLMHQNVEHQKEKMEMNVIMRDVLLTMKKEDHAMKMEQHKFQRESEERQMFARALPHLLNSVTGREVVPEAHGDSQLIEAIALKIEPQQLQMLAQMGIFTQEQILVLTNRFTKIREEHAKRREALATVPPEDSNDDKASA